MQMDERAEGGWPLGLHTLNAGLVMRSMDKENSSSVSFSTLLTRSPSLSSWDLDSESSGSFFRDRSITLGSLMGAASILELSRRSSRFRTSEVSLKGKKSQQNLRHSKPWVFSLCPRLCTDAVRIETVPSLGYFLEAERRAVIPSSYRKKKNSNPPPVLLVSDDPQTALPSGNVSLVAYAPRQQHVPEMIAQESGYGVSFLLSCLRGQIIG
ncbi:hypothetical protein SAY86_005343 [Trapa natans]|uniref:Uncharacterized protein n=1 Tax=Trapa natans TaxID=22666 RepID=A0AAN7L0U8_TRANT|nr:hypothetical protein SAY86_005343 [Trapa natans]